MAEVNGFHVPTVITKACSDCGGVFPATREYFYAGNTKTGIDCRCIECAKAVRRKYEKEHPEKMRESHRAACRRWYRRNIEKERERTRIKARKRRAAHRVEESNRRARLRGNGGTHTVADIERQYLAQKGRCYWCKAKVGKSYHVDHVVPTILGGSNGPENLVISCPRCNQSKHATHPMDFAGVMF